MLKVLKIHNLNFRHQMKQNKGGYFVKAQARSQGKEKGRGL